MTARLCSICKRPLDRTDDPLSEDCGGDCYDCIIWAEDGERAPDHLPSAEFRAWLDAREKRVIAFWDAATRQADIQRRTIEDMQGLGRVDEPDT